MVEEETKMINTSDGGVKIGSSDPEIEAEALVAAEVTDDDEKRGVLNFLKNQAKKEKFRDRLTDQLHAERKKAHHTRTKIRVKMPDGYIL